MNEAYQSSYQIVHQVKMLKINVPVIV